MGVPVMKVYKYPIAPGATVVEMPRSAQPLTVQMQGSEPMMWAAVDPTEPLVRWLVHCYGTGHQIAGDAGVYVGTFQTAGGAFVWHAFARPLS